MDLGIDVVLETNYCFNNNTISSNMEMTLVKLTLLPLSGIGINLTRADPRERPGHPPRGQRLSCCAEAASVLGLGSCSLKNSRLSSSFEQLDHDHCSSNNSRRSSSFEQLDQIMNGHWFLALTLRALRASCLHWQTWCRSSKVAPDQSCPTPWTVRSALS